MTHARHVDMAGGAEFDAIRSLLATWGERAVGIGDDAAVIEVPIGELMVVSTDASVENVHFRREWMSPEEIGARATAAALSDLAAMAAVPRGLLVALGVPERWRADLPHIADGIGAAAAAARCPIVGGNMSASSELSLTITVIGSAVRPLSRAGAQEGDIIYVTGLLGGPGAALRALQSGGTPSPEFRARFAAPVPRLMEARWLEERGARAAIDISDGLAADAAHLARASGVTILLDERAIPCMVGVNTDGALSSGEEYELIVAVPPSFDVSPREFERLFGIPLTAIGVAVGAGVEPVTLRGGASAASGGHDHMSPPRR